MPNYQVSFIFEGVQTATFGASAALGWTETWYVQADTIDAAFGGDVDIYTELRRLCLSDKYRMSFIRISEEPGVLNVAPNRVKIRTLNNKVGAIDDEPGNPEGRGAQVQCAILVNMMKLPIQPTERVHDRRFLMRGLPASVINGNVLRISGPYWNRFVNFFNWIAKKPTGVAVGGDSAASLGVRYQSPGFTKLILNGVEVNANDPHNITVNNAVTSDRGAMWRIAGVPGQNGRFLNKVWTQLSDAGSNPVFGRTRQPFDPSTVILYTGPGEATWQKVEWAYGPFDQYAIIGLRNKRTGRIFRQLRGRS